MTQTLESMQDIETWIGQNFGEIKMPPGVLFQEVVHSLSKEKAKVLFSSLVQKLRQVEKKQDRLLTAWTCLHMAMVYRGQRDYGPALNMLKKARSAFEADGNPVGLAALFEELSCVNRELSRNALALEYSQQAINYYQQLERPLELGWVYDNMSIIFLNMGRRQESLVYANKARDIFSEHKNESCLAWNACNLGNLNYELGRYDEAQQYYLEANKTFSKLNIRQGEAWSFLWLGMNARAKTDFKTSEDYLERSWKLFLALGLRDRAGWAVVNLGGIRWAQGRSKEAIELNKKAIQFFTSAHNNDGIAWGTFQNAQILRDQGRLSNAWQMLRRALNLYGHIANQKGAAWAECELGEIYMTLSDMSHARESFVKAKAIAEKLSLIPLQAEIDKNLAHWNLDQARLDEAGASLAAAAEIARRIGANEILADVLIAKTRAAVVDGDIEHAEIHANEAEKLIKAHGLHRLGPVLNLCRGEIHLARREPGEAVEAFENAAHQARALEQRICLAEAHLGLFQAIAATKGYKAGAKRLAAIEKMVRMSGSRELRAKFLALECISKFESSGFLDPRVLEQSLAILEHAGLHLLHRQLLELFLHLCEKSEKRGSDPDSYKIELMAEMAKGGALFSKIHSRKELLDFFPVSILA